MRHDLIPMAKYLHSNGVKEVIEIGTFKGFSALAFASVGLKVICIDPYVPNYDIGDGSSNPNMLSQAYLFFKENVLINENIFHIKKASLEAVNDFEDLSLDCVYIDGNHRYDQVKMDILSWKNKVKSGFFIGGHDWTRVDPNSHIKEVDNAVLETLGQPMLFGTNWLFKNE